MHSGFTANSYEENFDADEETDQQFNPALVPHADQCLRIQPPDRHVVSGWVDGVARPLLGGVDNCNFSFNIEVSDETYLAMLAEQQQARQAQKERNAAYSSDWLNARVLPSGGKATPS